MDLFKFRDKDGNILEWDSKTMACVLQDTMNTGPIEVVGGCRRIWLKHKSAVITGGVFSLIMVGLIAAGTEFKTSDGQRVGDGLSRRYSYVKVLRWNLPPYKSETYPTDIYLEERFDNGELESQMEPKMNGSEVLQVIRGKMVRDKVKRTEDIDAFDKKEASRVVHPK